jgi:hypothetical protein
VQVAVEAAFARAGAARDLARGLPAAVHAAFEAGQRGLKAAAKALPGRRCAVGKAQLADGLRALGTAKRGLLAGVASQGGERPTAHVARVAAATLDCADKITGLGADWRLDRWAGLRAVVGRAWSSSSRA